MPAEKLLTDPVQYARAILHAKSLPPANEEAVRVAITEALDRLYRAIAIDIDGTMTHGDESELEHSISDQIQDRLRRGIPVILVTGRGRTGADMVIGALQARKPDMSPGRLYCLIRNGAAILEPRIPGSQVRSQRLLVDAVLPAEVWKAVEAATVSAKRAKPQNAADEQNGAIRLEYATASERDAAIRELRTTVPAGFSVTMGKFAGIATINITAATKSGALTALAAELGLEPEEILRIGDQGAAGGNDADILDSIAGFSVDTLGTDADACHPIVDADGNVTKGVSATQALLATLHFSPPLKRTPTSISDLTIERFRDIERYARPTATTAISDLSHQMAESMVYLSTLKASGLVGPVDLVLSDIFDPASGGVRLRDYELGDVDFDANSPVQELFQLRSVFKAPPSGEMAMASDSGVLLRGQFYYRGFLTTAGQDPCGDYLASAKAILAECAAALNFLANQEASLSTFKLVLGIADNVRNIVLQVLYFAWVLDTSSGARDFDQLTRSMRVAQLHTDAHLKLLLRNRLPWKEAIGNYLDPVTEVHAFVSDFTMKLADAPVDAGQRKVVRELREADHFALNVAGVKIALERHRRSFDLRRNEHVTCFGLPYGGVELPLIAQALGPELDLDIKAGLLQASNYEGHEARGSKRLTNTSSVKELTRDAIHWPANGEFGTVLVADDNTTTGNTLQLAVDYLAVEGHSTVGAIMIQYPTAARRVHMELDGMGCVDPDALFTFVRGLVSPVPFTRLLRAPNSGNPFRDRLGTFNKAKKRIEQLLFKNFLSNVHPHKADK